MVGRRTEKTVVDTDKDRNDAFVMQASNAFPGIVQDASGCAAGLSIKEANDLDKLDCSSAGKITPSVLLQHKRRRRRTRNEPRGRQEKRN